jgi:3-hydroxyacyl-CoA dehydrogenase/enoyl-CoA hydratase/3-hydroxybutyryl-CoA epimerase
MITTETSTKKQDTTLIPVQPVDNRPKTSVPAMIRRQVRPDGICVLTFDRPETSANLFDRATLLELIEHLEIIEKCNDLKGLVLDSGKSSIFIAGADIHALSQSVSPDEIRSIVKLGQAAFNRLEALNIPTVAAIHGAAVGGGDEVCRACDLRLASPDRATKIGLPETKLGILPGWGGSTRLPRLVGVPIALDIILGGKTLAAKAAWKRGMVDEIVPREKLLDVACRRILDSGGKLSRKRLPWKVRLCHLAPVTRLIARQVKKKLKQKTGGHYPALERALNVVTQGMRGSVAASLKMEEEALTELVCTDVCHHLIELFFLQERAKKLGGKAVSGHKAVRNMTVVGAGVMGAGIAQWSSTRKVKVLLRDINAQQVGKGMAAIARLYQQGRKRRVFTDVEMQAGMDRISPSAEEVTLRNMDLVIEAAVEKMDLKKKIFQRLDDLAGPDTILATNTSALSVTELAQATRHPERVVGIHFFNPVHRMPLVEVVVGDQTSPEVEQRAVRYVQQIGKMPIVVRDRPGFLVNRILIPYMIEAGHLFEQGASVKEIDGAMLAFGMPMGPLRLIDEVGVDVSHHVVENVAGHFTDRLRVPQVLQQMQQAGWLGRKSGRGFYVHDQGGKKTQVHQGVGPFVKNKEASNVDREELSARMLLLMINEAARCLEEGVVESPADVDFGMVMGTGFAPFRGGPLRYADSMGAREIVAHMDRLVKQGETQFEPCALLRSMAAENKAFYNQDAGKGDHS